MENSLDEHTIISMHGKILAQQFLANYKIIFAHYFSLTLFIPNKLLEIHSIVFRIKHYQNM